MRRAAARCRYCDQAATDRCRFYLYGSERECRRPLCKTHQVRGICPPHAMYNGTLAEYTETYRL